MQKISDVEQKMKTAVAHMVEEFRQVRTGRAHPGLVENLPVTAYGTTTPLKGLASVSTPDPRTILISPWDKGVTKDIEKAIQTSKLGMNPAVVGTEIRLSVPQLTEERREELVKQLNGTSEKTRVTLRNMREEYLHSINEAVEKKEVSEDELGRAKKDVQQLMDKMNKEIEEQVNKKAEQIRAV